MCVYMLCVGKNFVQMRNMEKRMRTESVDIYWRGNTEDESNKSYEDVQNRYP